MYRFRKTFLIMTGIISIALLRCSDPTSPALTEGAVKISLKGISNVTALGKSSQNPAAFVTINSAQVVIDAGNDPADLYIDNLSLILLNPPDVIEISNETVTPDIECYYNSSDQSVYISLNNNSKLELQLEIFSINGSKLFDSGLQNVGYGPDQLSFHLGLSSGLYLCKITLTSVFPEKRIIEAMKMYIE